VTSTGAYVISDRSNHRIRLVSTSGIITTIAGNGVVAYGGDGGPATSASLYTPSGIAVTSTGAIVIADTNNNRIRLVSTLGIITTIAGNGAGSYGGDGGPATSASLGNPCGVAVTSTGAIVIADTYNHRIRLLSTSGIITTIAGNGAATYGGDGGPATSASLYYPQGVAVTSTDAIVIADTNNHRIRLIASSLAPTPSPTSTPSPTPYCFPSLFRSLPRMDLMGTLVGTALSPGSPILQPSESSCRQACCDAAACDGFSFAASELMTSATGSSACYLLVNITQLIPSNTMSSGVLLSTL
jgi:uncharacterized membrane protein